MATEEIPRPRGRLTRRREPPQWPPEGKHPLGYTLTGLVLGGYSWVLGGLAPFTLESFLGVLLPGAVLAGIACRWPPRRIPPPESLDTAGMSYWTIAVAALFEWEASAFKDNSLPWHPSLTDLVNPLLGTHEMKSAAVFLWLLAGWGLLRR